MRIVTCVDVFKLHAVPPREEFFVALHQEGLLVQLSYARVAVFEVERHGEGRRALVNADAPRGPADACDRSHRRGGAQALAGCMACSFRLSGRDIVRTTRCGTRRWRGGSTLPCVASPIVSSVCVCRERLVVCELAISACMYNESRVNMTARGHNIYARDY